MRKCPIVSITLLSPKIFLGLVYCSESYLITSPSGVSCSNRSRSAEILPSPETAAAAMAARMVCVRSSLGCCYCCC
ncbi:wsv248 [White spot syndrome virus]|uniref:Wsv248 n=4 Tax=White spot syndrome virus TaxID=342409 RepID=Q8VAX5_WSSVS|nr:wsv248 [Shrimp white spot syndrome virus]AFX59622.1 wsv248 [White spot syndrome virus]AAL33251.1 wsv248 [Shrimp white spot syndrome virus]AAL89171.1 WSSV303 [Shrimp white spot syndrome virus]AWQ60411.1 wsv248 [Shrimp white spot syndrome virus]AWQ60826.1 wsv248 [Shrimp white spot syndrome virus]